jgi:hypothetical protein
MMRSIFVLLVFGFLVSCAPTQTKNSQPIVGENWRLIISGSEKYQLTITDTRKLGQEVYFNATSNDGKASIISLTGVDKNGNLSNIIAFVSKTKNADVKLNLEAVNDEEGTLCIVPYSLEKKLFDGFYFKGLVSKISTLRSAADYDGKCTLEKL